MATKKYHIDGIGSPVVTDMVWSVATGINSQAQYSKQFEALFKPYTARGVVDKTSAGNIQVGVVDNKTADNENNCQSLALLVKNSIETNEELKRGGSFNIYIFALKEDIAYIVGILGKAIKIDQTLSLDRDKTQDELMKVLSKVSDIEFSNDVDVVVFHQDTSHGIESLTEIGSIADTIKSSTSNECSIVKFSDTCTQLISNIANSSSDAQFIRNVSRLKSKRGANKYVMTVVVAVIAFVSAGYWYTEKEKARKAEQLRLMQIAEQQAEELEARMAISRESDDKDQTSTDLERLALLKQLRFNQETRWLAAYKKTSGYSYFENAQSLIRQTASKAQGWATKDIIVSFSPTLEHNTLTRSYYQALERHDNSRTINDLVNVYPNVKGSLDGNKAFNRTVREFDLQSYSVPTPRQGSMFDLITNLQDLEYEGHIQAWTITQQPLSPPEAIDTELLELMQKYDSDSLGNAKSSEYSWLNDITTHKLIVSGSMTDLISVTGSKLTQITNAVLNKVSYNAETHNTILEVTIYETK